MPIFTSNAEHQPKGDHNRRLSLGVDIDDFAAEAGLTREQVHDYEMTTIDQRIDTDIAERYKAALRRLEANPPATQKVRN